MFFFGVRRNWRGRPSFDLSLQKVSIHLSVNWIFSLGQISGAEDVSRHWSIDVSCLYLSFAAFFVFARPLLDIVLCFFVGCRGGRGISAMTWVVAASISFTQTRCRCTHDYCNKHKKKDTFVKNSPLTKEFMLMTTIQWFKIREWMIGHIGRIWLLIDIHQHFVTFSCLLRDKF